MSATRAGGRVARSWLRAAPRKPRRRNYAEQPEPQRSPNDSQPVSLGVDFAAAQTEGYGARHGGIPSEGKGTSKQHGPRGFRRQISPLLPQANALVTQQRAGSRPQSDPDPPGAGRPTPGATRSLTSGSNTRTRTRPPGVATGEHRRAVPKRGRCFEFFGEPSQTENAIETL